MESEMKIIPTVENQPHFHVGEWTISGNHTGYRVYRYKNNNLQVVLVFPSDGGYYATEDERHKQAMRANEFCSTLNIWMVRYLANMPCGYIDFSRLWGGYKTDAQAKLDQMSVYRYLRSEGFSVQRSTLPNQMKKYDGLGQYNGSICNVYSLRRKI